MLGLQGDKPVVPRPPYSKLQNWLDNQKLPQLRRQSDRAQDIFRSVGITFNVYGDGDGVERLIPFDMVPRIITSKEWKQLEKGIRLGAVNGIRKEMAEKEVRRAMEKD